MLKASLENYFLYLYNLMILLEHEATTTREGSKNEKRRRRRIRSSIYKNKVVNFA
jgi:hypothetical protein